MRAAGDEQLRRRRARCPRRAALRRRRRRRFRPRPASAGRGGARRAPAAAPGHGGRARRCRARRDTRGPSAIERAGDGEHDVQRLGVERIAAPRCSACRRGCRRTARGPGPSARRGCRVWPARVKAADGLPASSGARVDLGLHLPLDAVLSAGLGVGQRAGGRDRAAASARAVRSNVPNGMIATFAGGWAGAGPSRGIQRLEEPDRAR